MMSEEQVEKLLSHLSAQWMLALENRSAPTPFVQQALADVFELYIATQDISVGSIKDKIEEGIKASATLAESCLEYIGSYVSDEIWKCYATWEQEDWKSWQTLCRIRSQLEIMKTLYQSYISAEKYEQAELPLLDQTIDENCGSGYLPGEYIPTGIPATHFWWWLPEKPS